MLLEFSFANFLSFRDKVTISMVATALRDRKADIGDATFGVGEDTAISLNRCCTLFGANASGKSNVVKALAFFKWFTMNSSKDVQAGEEIPVRNYALSSVSAAEPSLFEIMLFADGNTYRYGFEVNTKEVCREWLYIKSDKKRSKEIELFYRDGKRFETHPKFSIGKELADKNMVRDNALLLSLAGQFNDPYAKTIMNWLNDTTIITANSETEIWAIALKAMENPETRNRMVEFSRYADHVVSIEVDDAAIEGRMTGRRVCAKCGASYHIVANPPKQEGVCDSCGGELIIRKDDAPETVLKRLAVYHASTEVLKDYYAKLGRLHTVNGNQSIEGANEEILKAIGAKA